MVNQFVAHFGNKFKVQKSTQELLSSKPMQNESLSQFCTRFQLLSDDAQVEDNNALVVRYLISVFPEQLQWMIYQALDNHRIEEMSINQICDYIHGMPINNNQSYTTRNHTPNITKGKFCNYHKSYSHSNAECKYQANTKQITDKNTISNKNYTPLKNYANPNRFTNINSSVDTNALKNNTQPPPNYNKGPGTSKTVTCNKCQQIGHYANQCTSPSVNYTHLRENSKEGDGINCNKQEITPFTVPVYIKGLKTLGLIDTGADRTFISKELCKKLKVATVDIPGVINTAHPKITIPRIGITEPIAIQIGDTLINQSCEILEQCHKNTLIIGRDIIPKLHIEIFGLPYRSRNNKFNHKFRGISEIYSRLDLYKY
ncbi:hypothetical protein BB560_001584 [Smittium megazygosporum]|uniref:CCHC-type domain-containing protein n=1 Tax=Smittium megazygosporum TaxID=133381 RepID=A0A2T9ZHD0_9FUNG|nr:hypothetical protein BB560_001584 [Smittium megazygosporum]